MKRLFTIISAACLAISAMAIVPPRLSQEDLERLQADPAAREAFMAKVPARIAEEAQATQLSTGVRKTYPRVLVIMTQFSDKSLQPSTTKAFVDSLFNGTQYHTANYRTGTAYSSVRQYFIDQSNGQYAPQFDIVGPVTVSGSCTSYYNRTLNTSIISEVCSLVDDSIDFSQYDVDNDGVVDLIYLYYAGYGQNDEAYITTAMCNTPSALIWPHLATMNSTQTFDGKRLAYYECSNELDAYVQKVTGKITHAGIGTPCHEFGHGLGLPDLYNTQTSNSSIYTTLGYWDIMCYGMYANEGYQPSGYTAYEKWFMGWIDPIALNSAQQDTLTALSQGGNAAVLTASGEKPFEANTAGGYYLLENRQKTGWDAYAPGHGLLVTRLNYVASKWSSNTINTGTNRCFTIVSADGTSVIGQAGAQRNCYPYGDLDSILLVPDYPITEITELADGRIAFKVCGGEQHDTPTEYVYVNENEDENENNPSASSGANGNGKRIVNGRLVIVHEGKMYDVLGGKW